LLSCCPDLDVDFVGDASFSSGTFPLTSGSHDSFDCFPCF
jgi:hypothetical protein